MFSFLLSLFLCWKVVLCFVVWRPVLHGGFLAEKVRQCFLYLKCSCWKSLKMCACERDPTVKLLWKHSIKSFFQVFKTYVCLFLCLNAKCGNLWIKVNNEAESRPVAVTDELNIKVSNLRRKTSIYIRPKRFELQIPSENSRLSKFACR